MFKGTDSEPSWRNSIPTNFIAYEAERWSVSFTAHQTELEKGLSFHIECCLKLRNDNWPVSGLTIAFAEESITTSKKT